MFSSKRNSQRKLFVAFLTVLFQHSLTNREISKPFPQHTSVDGYTEPHVPPPKSSSRQNIPRCRNSITSATDEQPHIGNYRLQKTIGKGNFAKVKLARHVLTGREVSFRDAFSCLPGRRGSASPASC